MVFGSSLYTAPPGASVTLEFDVPAAATIYPQGIFDDGYGTPLAWLGQQWAYPPSVGDSAAVGSPGVDYFRVRPTSVPDTSAVGTPFVWLGQQWAVIEPIVVEMQAGHRVFHDDDYVAPANAPDASALVIEFGGTAYSPPTGAGAVLNFEPPAAPTLYPAGINAAAFGTAAIQNFTQYAAPSGIASAAFGVPSAWLYTRFALPAGISPLAFGTAAVQNKNRYLTLTGLSPLAFGTAAVRTNKILPAGIQASVVPAPKVHGNKLFPAGINKLAFGLARIEDRTVLPSGFDAASVSAPLVDLYVRYVYPEGFEGTEWNDETFIADEIRYVTGVGTDMASFGSAIVTKSPAPTVGDTALFGTTRVDLWRRYLAPTEVDALVYVDGSPRTDANRMYGKAVISNKIRYVMPSAIQAASVGTSRIENYVRYLLPKGFDSSRTGTAWASYYVRVVTAAGFDAAVVWDDFGPIDPITGRPAHIRLADGGTIQASGIDANSFGEPDIGHEVRNILARSATCHCVTQFGMASIA